MKVQSDFFFSFHHGFILRASQRQTCWNLGEEIFAFECCYCMLLGSLIWKLFSLFICFYGKHCCHLYKGIWIKHQNHYPKIIKEVWITLTNSNTCFVFILKAYTKDKDTVLYVQLTLIDFHFLFFQINNIEETAKIDVRKFESRLYQLYLVVGLLLALKNWFWFEYRNKSWGERGKSQIR